jgi:hypothetical protein
MLDNEIDVWNCLRLHLNATGGHISGRGLTIRTYTKDFCYPANTCAKADGML